jgi:ribosome biogenesis GTPase
MFDFQTMDLAALRGIGLAQAQLQQLTEVAAPPGAALERVTEVQREHYLLHDGHGEWPARIHPTLWQALAARDSALVVGDWVLVLPDAAGGTRWIVQRVPPRNQLVRRDTRGAPAPIVANVDLALLVMGLDADFNLGRLERYLSWVRLADVSALVVLTKADLAADVQARLAACRERLPREVEVVAVNALAEVTRETLRPWLAAGQTAVLLGSSGAGKSTLTNTLAARLLQDTGPVRRGDERGQHTTTARTLYRLPGGACLIDTPGLRTLQLGAAADAVAATFDDIVQLAPLCRFRDCRHGAEPGCRVREEVTPERLQNYHKLLREARRDQLTVLDRRVQLATWKARSRAARQRVREKAAGA